jgi:hypothetical protein
MRDHAGDFEAAGVRSDINGSKGGHGAENSEGGSGLYGQDTSEREVGLNVENGMTAKLGCRKRIASN